MSGSSLPDNWQLTPDAYGWVPPDGTKTHIVCAANRAKGGLIFCGSRHGSAAMHSQMSAAGIEYQETEDGFIDRYDRFWTREQALEIMLSTGQKMLHQGDWGNELYSENLY